MKRFLAAPLAVLVVFFTGCAAMNPTADAPDLNGTAWVLSALPGRTLAAGAPVTAQFEGGRVAGTDGCNRYFAPYTRSGGTLQVGERGGMTMMACPPETMKQAEAFMAAMKATRSYRVDGNRLELLGADRTVLAAFTAQSQSLAGTSWIATGYNNGRQAVVSSINGTELTIQFGTDGRYSGSAGCNRFNGSFTQQGGRVTLGPAAATRRMCVEPKGVMEQEAAFLKALETATTARFEADRLELRTADGAMAATLARAK
jgi:heat shock protein HslJ